MEASKFRSDVTVELLKSAGGDDSIVEAMLVSTQGAGALGTSATAGRIGYLMRSRHGSPFEHNLMTFLVEAPIFVFREFHRHRIGWSYNEVSGRYRELDPVFYLPDASRPLVQVGKPGSYAFEQGNTAQYNTAVKAMSTTYETAYAAYQRMIEAGIAKELARSCLPVGTYSAMFATCNARSLMAFLSLRTRDNRAAYPSTPQYEIELVANAMEESFSQLFPLTYEAYCRYGRVAP